MALTLAVKVVCFYVLSQNCGVVCDAENNVLSKSDQVRMIVASGQTAGNYYLEEPVSHRGNGDVHAVSIPYQPSGTTTITTSYHHHHHYHH